MPGGDDPALLGLIATLDELGLRYAVGGSLASSAHGAPRTTHDADVLVDLPADRLAALLARVTAEFYVSEEAARRAVGSGTSFNLVHLATGDKVDLFVASSAPLDVLQLETARASVVVEGAAPVRVTSPEVVVLRKLLWYRSGGEVSERQWRDVVGVLRVQGPDDLRDRVRPLAADLGVVDLLERAAREAAGA